ncbi:hypothetical protein [Micromonospora sp. NPDC049171]|uniref:hypothetical protein n=1 Tax=Micromonospora sp. NPDC049171 TaxID=3155770 RepID=UPI0033EC09F5
MTPGPETLTAAWGGWDVADAGRPRHHRVIRPPLVRGMAGRRRAGQTRSRDRRATADLPEVRG